MIQMGALDEPPAHAMRSLSSALTEGRHNVPTNIKATPGKAKYNLNFISLPLPCCLRTAGTLVLAASEFNKQSALRY